MIGIAGSPEKCAWVTDELGFGACIDYKRDDVAAPQGARTRGVDVYFDNVGASSSTPCSAGSACGRASCCAATSRPTTRRAPRCATCDTSWAGGRAWRASTRSTRDRYEEAAAAARGRPTGSSTAHVLDGIDRAPEALVRLFTGDHLGKLVVQVSLGRTVRGGTG